jgi:hypothetical protein
MDEQISFDQVALILDSSSVGELVHNLVDGNEHRYGRITFGGMALASALPRALAGESGQIIATRMFQALTLGIGLWVLCVSLVRRGWPRVVAFALALGLPATSYYAHMPKPEPMQLLFLALFLWAVRRRGNGPGLHWVWLGLAFGSKISALPPIGVAGLAACWWCYKHGFRDVWKVPVAFMLGLLLAEPVLLLPGSGWEAWWDDTFANRGHGRDSSLVGVLDWFSLLANSLRLSPWILSIGGAAGVALVALHTSSPDRREVRWLAMGMGGAWFAALAVSVDRLWGFYLAIPIALLVIAIVGACFDVDTRRDRWLMLTTALFLLLPSGMLGWWSRVEEYHTLATRTETPTYRRFARIHDELIVWLDERFGGGKLDIIYIDPRLFDPRQGDGWVTKRYWGPFIYWNQRAPAILMRPEIFNRPPEPRESASHLTVRAFLEGKQKHVAPPGQPCEASPCYHRVPGADPELVTLVLDPES